MAGISIMGRKRFTLSAQQNNLCFYCKCEMNKFGTSPRHKNSTVEHLTRKCEGGGNAISNLAVACYRCNSQRGDFSVEEWKLLCIPIIRIRHQKDAALSDCRASVKRWKKRHNIIEPEECKYHPVLMWLDYIRKNMYRPQLLKKYCILENERIQSILQIELKAA